MKRRVSTVKRGAVALTLALSFILSALFLISCNEENSQSASVSSEVPEELTGEERNKARDNIEEDDRAGYLAAIEKYAAYLNGDPEGMRDLRPEDFYEELEMTPDEYVELLRKTVESSRQANIDKYGEGYEVTYEIKSEKNYDAMIDSLRSTIEEKQGIAPERVEKAYSVYVTFTVSGPKSEESNSTYIIATKIDDSWYLIGSSGEFD